MKPNPLNQQVVVITGASSGIGREAALKFADRGAQVVLAARGGDALRELADSITANGGVAHVVPTDVSIWEEVSALAEEAIRVFGRVDTWVNDAGVSVYGMVDEISVDEMEQVIQTDLLGPMYGCKAILPHMRRQGFGTIINVASVAGKRAIPLQAPYCAAKHGIKGFSEALRLELEHSTSGINVTTIFPTSINTPFFSHARSKMGVKPRPISPVYDPALAADAIVYAAQHPQRDVYVGGAGFFLDALERVSPALADRFMMAGDIMFKQQKTDEPYDGSDNLFEPNDNRGQVRGEFGHLVKPSLYTRLFELSPLWQRVLIPAVAAGAVTTFISMRKGR
jgi:short-subunit dehydrogenase